MIRNLCIALVGLGALAGCAPQPVGMRDMPDSNRMMQKSELMQKLMTDPQVPAWHDTRTKMTQAIGDRVFDKSFDEVFNGIVVALASMESNVANMERQSGYINASVPRLRPERQEQLKNAMLVEYCQAHGYDPKLLEKDGQWDTIDVGAYAGMMQQKTMTISLVKQSPTQTKVKIRFAQVNYPPELQEYYKVVWPAIDKQIFLDRNLD